MGAAVGDVVSVKYSLEPDLKTGRASSFDDNANKITDSLSFDVGDVSFVVGGGGYIDEIHSTVLGMDVGDSVTDVSVDAGYGEYNEEGRATVPIEQAPAGLKQGMAVMLSTPNGQIQATVTEMNDETLTLDTNHPLAGCKFLLSAEVTSLEPPSNFQVATVAGGCFWGLELAYQREPGVVGTAVGYTQGETEEPTYQQVCSGTTGHTEGVQVVFDPRVVSYKRLCELLVDRLGDSIYLLNQVGNDRGSQYRHGVSAAGSCHRITTSPQGATLLALPEPSFISAFIHLLKGSRFEFLPDLSPLNRAKRDGARGAGGGRRAQDARPRSDGSGGGGEVLDGRELSPAVPAEGRTVCQEKGRRGDSLLWLR